MSPRVGGAARVRLAAARRGVSRALRDPSYPRSPAAGLRRDQLLRGFPAHDEDLALSRSTEARALSISNVCMHTPGLHNRISD